MKTSQKTKLIYYAVALIPVLVFLFFLFHSDIKNRGVFAEESAIPPGCDPVCVEACKANEYNPCVTSCYKEKKDKDPNKCIEKCWNEQLQPCLGGCGCQTKTTVLPPAPPPPTSTPSGGGTGSSSPIKPSPYPGFGIFKIGNCGNINDPGKNELACVVQKALDMLVAVTGAIVVVMIIISGIGYMTSMGNANQTAWAKKSLVGAIIGLIIVVMAYSIVKLMTILLNG